MLSPLGKSGPISLPSGGGGGGGGGGGATEMPLSISRATISDLSAWAEVDQTYNEMSYGMNGDKVECTFDSNLGVAVGGYTTVRLLTVDISTIFPSFDAALNRAFRFHWKDIEFSTQNISLSAMCLSSTYTYGGGVGWQGDQRAAVPATTTTNLGGNLGPFLHHVGITARSNIAQTITNTIFGAKDDGSSGYDWRQSYNAIGTGFLATPVWSKFAILVSTYAAVTTADYARAQLGIEMLSGEPTAP